MESASQSLEDRKQGFPKSIRQSILAGERGRILLEALVLFVLFFAALTYIQFASPALAGNDAYYHIKFAYLMRTEGLKPDFPYLPLSILNAREFYDHHFLFHVALIPFTFGDLLQGAKWGGVTFTSLAFVAVWWLLRRQRIPFAPLWALGLLAVSDAFLYRMSMVRAQTLSLAVLAVGMHWMLQRRYRLLGLLGFGYVWLYNAFPLLPMIAGVYLAAVLLVERRLEWKPLAWTTAGVALGLLINPYFPYNLSFIFHHLTPKLMDATAVRVGNEWFAYRTDTILGNSPGSLLALVGGSLALGFSGKRIEVRTAFAFLLTVMFGVMLFQSRRFVEYFPAFAMTFAAFAFTPLIEDFLAHSGSYFKRNLLPANVLVGGILAAVVLAGAVYSVPRASALIADSAPAERFRGAATWLSRNTPQGARVFQTDWDDFTRLFFYNTHNTYLAGLDPTYLQIYNPDLYDTWQKITNGEVENPSRLIRDLFGSLYVVSDLNHTDFLNTAAADPGLIEVYRDGNAVVLQVTE